MRSRTLTAIHCATSLILCSACGDSSSPTAPSTAPTTTSIWNLSGTVSAIAPTPTPIEGATVAVVDGPDQGKTATTDNVGLYQFTGLQQAEFRVSASADGYSSATADVNLTSNTTLNLELELSPATGVLTGLVREYASPNGALDPVADARVEVTSGPAGGRSTTTSASGSYRLEELPPGTIQLLVTKEGFQDLPETTEVSSDTSVFDMLVRRNCSPWPSEVQHIMARLSLPSGLCLIRQPNGRSSNYHTQTRTVYLRGGSPATGEVGSLAHEIAHAHQHQVVLEAGLGEPGFDDDFIPKWVSTREGASFVELTGWRHDPNADQRRPPFGWSEGPCEPWSCGYPNPLEDAAEFTAYYYGFGLGDPRVTAPERFRWAEEFIPR